MALTFLGLKSDPMYLAISSDIVNSKISGASVVGGHIYLTDLKSWKIINLDLTVSDYVYPFGASVDIGVVGITGIAQVSGVVGITGIGMGATGGSILVEGREGGTPQSVVGLGNPVSVTFTGYTGQAYSAKDNVGIYLIPTGATGASPIVVTTSVHGFADGEAITISGVTGNTAMNGNNFAKVTGYTGTQFALYSDKVLATPVAANGTFAGTSVTIAKLFRLPNFFRINSGTGYITKIRMMTDNSAWTDQFRITFYDSPVTALVDNAPFTIAWTNAAARLGACTLPAFQTEASGSTAAYTIGVPGDGVSGLPLFVRNGDGTRDLYFRVEDLGTSTPGVAQNFYFDAVLDEN